MIDTEPRIYVAVLADYNAGELTGEWIDCDGKDADELGEDVARILRTSRHPNVSVPCPDCGGDGQGERGDCDTCKGTGEVPSAEEFAIHDHEGFPKGTVGEYSTLAEVAEIVEALAEHEHNAAAFFALVEWSDSLAEASATMRDGFLGEHDSLERYAEEFLDSMGTLDDASGMVSQYFDFAQYGRDLETGGDVFTVDAPGGGVFVFDGHV